MPGVILHILSIIGLILLALLCFVLFLLLIILFCPITYRAKGNKNTEGLAIAAGANWLFGILRVRYAYPEPGDVTVRILWKTLFDSGSVKKKKETGEPDSGKPDSGKSDSGKPDSGEPEKIKLKPEDTEERTAEASQEEMSGGPFESQQETVNSEPIPEEGNIFSRLFSKIQKIKYTILKICDKIKEIWANISYYTGLLQEENTARLWKHVKLRLGKILKSVRPRHIRAEITFGTGAPDTTGYIYGVYCMFSPALGGNICVTPDFDQAILEGTVTISGHITVFICLWNALKLLLDKKLHLFLKKLKAGREKDGR